MANPEHLSKLKEGVKVWNEWWKEQPNIQPDLVGAHLRDAHLSEAELDQADLREANLYRVNLSFAYLREAILNGADLREANLYGVNLIGASLVGAILNGADLSGANLFGTDLSGADLSGADFSHAHLIEADLSGATLSGATVARTTFGNVNLSVVKGLDTVRHDGPSTIGIDTIYLSQGNIPEIFLKGAGVDDTSITYIRSLVGKPIEYYSCFISYSSKDQDIANRLCADLQSEGVRCWLASKDMKTGDRIRYRIDEAIRHYDKLLLILSEASLASDWVEDEAEAAFEKERIAKEQGQERTVLFPIRLDDMVKNIHTGWSAQLRRKRHITDFTSWKDHGRYQAAFSRLLHDLKAESHIRE